MGITPTTIIKPQIKRKETRRELPNSLKRQASWRLSELYRIAEFRRKHGVTLNVKNWIYVLAATLACGRPGIIHIKRLTFYNWHGLDAGSLESACRQCGIESVTPQERAETMDRVDAWVQKEGPRLFKADTVAHLLQVTAEERCFAHVKTIGAIDENLAARQLRRKSDDAERQRATRHKMGCKPRSEYLANSLSKAKPWQAAGLSRAKWYRLGKPMARPTGDAMISPIATSNEVASSKAA